ncbi:MAG: aldolase [Planctomycetia bacterium]|nr:aldolase [Planctomycetia bacterium]
MDSTRQNHVKRALREGRVAVGTMVFEFATPGIARIAAAAGAEFILYDMEHTGWSVETIRMLMATTRCTNLVPLVRVPATEYHFVARALDAGALGLMVPMVETPEQARRIVQYTQYPPAGQRGAAFGVAHDDYTGGDIVAKMRTANDETMIIALIESVQGIENVDAIAAVDGIDVLWLGHFDLTNSQGIPGQFTHPTFLAAVEKLLAAAKKHGKAAGMMAANVPDAKARLAQGFRCLAYGGDLWLYQNALREGIEGVKKQVV